MQWTIEVPDDLPSLGDGLTDLDVELGNVIRQLTEAHTRVQQLLRAERTIADTQRRYLSAAYGTPPPEVPFRGETDFSAWPEWRQPLGAHDAHPVGWVVRHNDKLWENERPSNVWEPGTQNSGWLDVTPEPGEPMPDTPEEVEYTAWEPGRDYRDGRDGAVDGDGNLIGRDYVGYFGFLYACVTSHTSQPDWTPPETPALWTEVAELPPEIPTDPEDPTDPEEPVDPEEPTEPDPEDPVEEYPAWTQSTGAHDAYNQGERVVYEGDVWESNMDGNVWPPPTNWTLVE